MACYAKRERRFESDTQDDRKLIADWELWAVANTVIQQHGEGAADFVAGRVRALEAKGDDLGCAAWGLILLRIAELQRQAPDEGETVQ